MKKSTGIEKDLDELFGKKPQQRPEEYIQECFRLMREGKLLGILVSVHQFGNEGRSYAKNWATWSKKAKPKGKR